MEHAQLGNSACDSRAPNDARRTGCFAQRSDTYWQSEYAVVSRQRNVRHPLARRLFRLSWTDFFCSSVGCASNNRWPLSLECALVSPRRPPEPSSQRPTAPFRSCFRHVAHWADVCRTLSVDSVSPGAVLRPLPMGSHLVAHEGHQPERPAVIGELHDVVLRLS
jgi:hypothetical protein